MSGPGHSIGAQNTGDTEIHHLYRTGLGQHHVRRFDIAVDYAGLVRR